MSIAKTGKFAIETSNSRVYKNMKLFLIYTFVYLFISDARVAIESNVNDTVFIRKKFVHIFFLSWYFFHYTRPQYLDA